MNRKWLTWGISLLVLAVLAWFFRGQLGFIKEGLSRLRHSDPLPVVLVLVFALGSVAAMAEVMRLLLRAGNVRIFLWNTFAVSMAANAWSTTLPAGAAFSAVLTFNVQRRWGSSVALCGFFFFLSSVISSMWLALIGLAGVFFLNANMALGSLITTVVLMVAATGAIFWLTENPDKLSALLRKVPFLQGERLDKVLAEVDKLYQVHISRFAFLGVSAFSLFHRVCDVLALWACVWAVTGEMPWLRSGDNATTMAGVALAFIAAKLAGTAQVTPGGLGTVEAALIAPLVATGMTAADATSAAIIYRLISFALVTALGWVIYFLCYARHGLTYSSLNESSDTTSQANIATNATNATNAGEKVES